MPCVGKPKFRFQHTAARRRLGKHTCLVHICIHVSTHSRPKAAGRFACFKFIVTPVSTHSRPKAAGPALMAFFSASSRFQHTAARRRLGREAYNRFFLKCVSTHSRPKAAGITVDPAWEGDDVSTHSRPKAAGKLFFDVAERLIVSTHSRPKAAGTKLNKPLSLAKCFNTQPPEGGWQPNL